MANEVRELKVTPAQEKRRQACTKLLEEAVEKSKRGPGFETVLVVTTYPENQLIDHATAGDFSVTDLVGKLEHLKFELLAGVHETDEADPRPGPGEG